MGAENLQIAVVGLGYVGLPVAAAVSRCFGEVIAYDTDAERLAELRSGVDRTGEVDGSRLAEARLRLVESASHMREADFIVVTVPTPLNDACHPDLGPLLAATRDIGHFLQPGAVVVYESTVYPGATEEKCVPLLAEVSGKQPGRDFSVGYSPERINPGDGARQFETLAKVVAGQDRATRETIAEVYERLIDAPIHRAPDIKTAETAKVIENTQRDLNIALMNELAMICRREGIDVRQVLEAAATKWNFLTFHPGLVGGHCIGVDPHYLTFRAEQLGYHPDVVLAGRRINNEMPAFVARELLKMLLQDQGGRGRRVAVLGATFKPDVKDVRNSKVPVLISELEAFGVEVFVNDPKADAGQFAREFGRPLQSTDSIPPCDAVVLAVGHDVFRRSGWSAVTAMLSNSKGVVVDVPALLPPEAMPAGVSHWRL
jgi:UDP-N-acetyl-D-galactosamine dehydrogenase